MSSPDKLAALTVALLIALAAACPTGAEAAKKKRVKHKTVATEQTNRHRGSDKFRAGPLYYNGGQYLGDDPDPNIRFQIWRDLGAHYGPPD